MATGSAAPTTAVSEMTRRWCVKKDVVAMRKERLRPCMHPSTRDSLCVKLKRIDTVQRRTCERAWCLATLQDSNIGVDNQLTFSTFSSSALSSFGSFVRDDVGR